MWASGGSVQKQLYAVLGSQWSCVLPALWPWYMVTLKWGYLDLRLWDGLGMHLSTDTSSITCHGPWHEWIMDSNVKQGLKAMKPPRRHFLPWNDGDFKQLSTTTVVNGWQTSSSLILPKNSLVEKLHLSKWEHRCFKLPTPILKQYSTPSKSREALSTFGTHPQL